MVITKTKTHDKRSRSLHAIALLLLGLLTGACAVWSKNPALPAAGGNVDPTPFLGRWEAREILGQTPGGPTPPVEVRRGEQGELVLAMTSGTEVKTRIAQLASLGGRSVVSIRNELGNWNVFALELDTTGTTLTVRAPNLEALESAMTTGTLSAARPEFFFDGDEIEIRAGAEELAAYFAAHPEVFDVVAAILARRPPGG